MAQGPSDTILVAIRITLQIQESKVRNPDPPDRRRFALSEHSFLVFFCIKLCICMQICGVIAVCLLVLVSVTTFILLADCTIGRAYGTVCRLSVCLSSVCRLSVTFCIVAKRCILAKKCLKE